MNGIVKMLRRKKVLIAALAIFSAIIMVVAPYVWAQTPEPVVAIHVSELTQALETMPAMAPTPTGPGTTGYEWWVAEWHYFVGPESLKEALRSDGTPFVEVSDADIAAGHLLYPDGSPRYPILISLASEAIDNSEIAPLRDYVAAGGILFIGSSAFTRNPDGTTRGDFALANEMGLHMVNPTLQNWYENRHFSKITDHRLALNIPAGTISWRMPHDSEEVPLGVSPSHSVHGRHYVFHVSATSGTTVIANGDSGPLLANRQYGEGNFVYHGAMQPLIGHTVYDPSMYAYLIYRHAIEWAFEAANLPIIKLSPWPYEYDAAFIVRHDFENNAASIRSIENSASFEHSVGVKGDYYFCTGTLRQEMPDKNTVVASLQRAVTNHGATIGSHNGGLRNPVNTSLPMSNFDYWHWGPDEALDITPPGYASGKAYAQESISLSFQDIEGWLAGVDNGRAGCGSAGNCPRMWASPYMNSTREDSYDILEGLGAVSMGEQKIGPFPHRTLSTQTAGKRYPHVSVPTSDWYVGTEIPGALEWGHTTDSMQAAVDFYYNLGAPINLYGHVASIDATLMGEYVTYSAAKSRMWATNSVGISGWWQVRSNAVVTPSYNITGNTDIAQATIIGATDPDTAIEVAIPNGNFSNLQVFINDAPASPADYRAIGNAIRVRVGATTSSAKVQYTIFNSNPVPTTTSLSPTAAIAGGAAFTLTVNGSGFVASSVAQWNGASRTTTYVSTTQLTSTIPAADIAMAGTAQVTVFTPAPGGGTSNAQTFTINNPVPATTSLSPATANAGGPAFTLTVNGTGFVSNSVVRWNGVDRQTTYVSTTQLTAAILAEDIATAGTASVTVFNPAPGGGTSNAQTFTISDSQAGTWTQTDWVGGGGQSIWADTTRYDSASGIDNSVNGQISLASNSTVLFSDDFSDGTLSPWTAALGTWAVTGGVLQGSGNRNQYSYAYISTTPQWANYMVQGRIQIPAGSFGGGIGGRVYPATGAHYGAWVYPAGSAGGSNLLKLWKFRGWTDIGAGVPMQQVSLPVVGTGWHTLQMTFIENRILVYYDGDLKIDVTDNNYDSWAPYLGGGISADWWTWSLPYTIVVDNISVVTLPTYGSSGVLLSSAYGGGDGVQWQTVSWDATAGGSTNVCVKTRTADSSDQLANATWSNCYSASGSGIMSENRRWIQYQLELTTSDTSTSPVFNEIRTSYVSGSSGAPVPLISGLAPMSATAGGAAFTLTVDGSGFANGSVVQWNGVDRTTTYVSSTQLTAAIPAADIAAAGTAQVTVFTPAPGGGTSNAQTFTINVPDNPVPAITALSPASSTAGGPAFTLTVNGSNFVNASVVRWNGTDRATTYVSSTQLTAEITTADIAVAGTAQVTVFNPAPGGGISNAQTFTINNPNNPVPATTDLSPAAGNAGGSAFTLTVDGTGFVTGSVVQWNGVDRTTTFVSTTQLTAAIPATDIAVAGTASVTVFNPTLGGGTSNAQTFTINNPVPATTGLSPAFTTAGGSGFTLTVNGSGFINGSVVQWNGVDRTTTFVSSNQLTAAIQAADIATAGTAQVTVFNPAPGGGISNAQTFTINNPVPATTDLSPAAGNAGGSAFTLTVNGTGFVPGSIVRWNGTNHTTTYVSTTQLTAAIPAADIAVAGTAQVTVFNPAPGGGTSNAQTFTINAINNPVPTTTGLSPMTANAGGSDFTLTVDGSGFVNGSVVRWNGVDRTTTYVSSTQLTAAILTTDIATEGTARVTVFNPAPGEGTSNAQTFTINAPNTLLFSDDFTRPPDSTNPLSPWVASMGTWTVTGGVLQGSGNPRQYSYASISTTPQWTDYTVQGRIQIPAGSFGGGIGGRVDPTIGAHYGAWVYPTGSPGGSNLLKLWKFLSWTDIGGGPSVGVPMQQVSLPAVGTGWHTLQMTFVGNRILVYYDGVLKIDVTDNNYYSRAPYLSGGISTDWWTWSLPYTITVDDISVVTQ
jgi:hypothetical protein